MNKDGKSFMKKKGKWEIYELEKNGKPFKILVEKGQEGVIKQIMEKPNFKEMEKEICLSGAHLILDFPERNHVDFFENGVKTKIEKTPHKNFGYWTSGSLWGI